MPFNKSRLKIEDASLSIRSLDAVDSAIEYKSKFSASINAINSIWDTLKAEGKSISGFDNWKEARWKEIESDELLHQLREWRRFDYHTGTLPLIFGTHISAAKLSASSDGPIVIGGDGIYTIINQGTPDEERVPLRDGAKYTVSIALSNAPTMHLGNNIKGKDPKEYLEIALKYYRQILHDASMRFK